MGSLGPFPVDAEALRMLREALNATYVIEDGEHKIVGADFSVAQLLDFYSGYDKSKLVVTEDGWTEYPDSLYTVNDVLLALIEEVERLRKDK